MMRDRSDKNFVPRAGGRCKIPPGLSGKIGKVELELDRVNRRFQVRSRLLMSIGALAVTTAAMSLMAVSVVGQAPTDAKGKGTAAAKAYTPPRTADADVHEGWISTAEFPGDTCCCSAKTLVVRERVDVIMK